VEGKRKRNIRLIIITSSLTLTHHPLIKDYNRNRQADGRKYSEDERCPPAS
jgi:hypothetical protein